MKIRANKDKWQSLLVKPIAIGLLAGFGSLFTPAAAQVACELELNGDVEILHLGGRNMIVYWEEDCTPPDDPDIFVMYQTSSDNGKTWSGVEELTSSEFIAVGGFVDDFDGILIVAAKKERGRLVASFSIEGARTSLKVVTSNNFGRDWGDPILAWDITTEDIGFSDFLSCPSLTAESIPGSGVLSLLTTIVGTGGAFAWIVTSRDSGVTWDAAIELGEVPPSPECDD